MNKSQKIGIFLGYAPEQSIREHGLGRLLAWILQGLMEQNAKVVIAMPHWSLKEMSKLLKDFNINGQEVEWLTTKHDPILLKVRAFFLKRKKSRVIKKDSFFVRLKNLKSQLFSRALKLMARLLTTSSVFVATLVLLLFIAGLAVLPFLLIIYLLAAGLSCGWKYVSKFSSKVLSKPISLFLSPFKNFKNNVFAIQVYDELRATEFSKLFIKINGRKDIKSWLIPTMFWPEVAKIKAPKVIVVPDIVYLDFPMPYSNLIGPALTQRVEKSLAQGNSFICYSNFVKESQLVDKIGIPPNKVQVIPHAAINSNIHFKSSKKRRTPQDILKSYIKKNFSHDRYLKGFDFSKSNFLFYSSQIRAHKNILSLIKAYEKLLREEMVNVKLVLTASLLNQEAAPILDYIWQNRLQFDVLSFPTVPIEVLAALNHFAVCAVNPTLFEGGFPFTFSEAYSVGTPSVMSSIPVVLDTVDDLELRKIMLFDPYDVNDMCAKIKWAVQNTQTLFDRQSGLYNKLSSRTWKQVAGEYMEVLHAVAEPV